VTLALPSGGFEIAGTAPVGEVIEIDIGEAEPDLRDSFSVYVETCALGFAARQGASASSHRQPLLRARTEPRKTGPCIASCGSR
jgi:hypothetical protein